MRLPVDQSCPELVAGSGPDGDSKWKRRPGPCPSPHGSLSPPSHPSAGELAALRAKVVEGRAGRGLVDAPEAQHAWRAWLEEGERHLASRLLAGRTVSTSRAPSARAGRAPPLLDRQRSRQRWRLHLMGSAAHRPPPSAVLPAQVQAGAAAVEAIVHRTAPACDKTGAHARACTHKSQPRRIQ